MGQPDVQLHQPCFRDKGQEVEIVRKATEINRSLWIREVWEIEGATEFKVKPMGIVKDICICNSCKLIFDVFYNSRTSFSPLKMYVIGLKERDMIPLLNSTVSPAKNLPKSPKYHPIILENIKQDDEMEVSESSDYVDFIWCLLRAKWLCEMEIKVCVCVWGGGCVLVYVHMHSKAEQTISLHLYPYRFCELKYISGFKCSFWVCQLYQTENFPSFLRGRKPIWYVSKLLTVLGCSWD